MMDVDDESATEDESVQGNDERDQEAGRAFGVRDDEDDVTEDEEDEEL